MSLLPWLSGGRLDPAHQMCALRFAGSTPPLSSPSPLAVRCATCRDDDISQALTICLRSRKSPQAWPPIHRNRQTVHGGRMRKQKQKTETDTRIALQMHFEGPSGPYKALRVL